MRQVGVNNTVMAGLGVRTARHGDAVILHEWMKKQSAKIYFKAKGITYFYTQKHFEDDVSDV